MLRNYFFINVILVVIIAGLGFKLYEVAHQSTLMPAAPAKTTDKKTAANEKRGTDNQITNEAEYDVIASLDLFRPTRSPAPPKELETVKPPPKEPPKLFGTIIFNEYKSAILQDSDTKSTKTYKINDSISGFVIKDIREDKVVLLREGENIEVKLRDDKGVVANAPTMPRAPGVPQQAIHNQNIRQSAQQPDQAQAQAQSRIRRSRRPVPPRQRTQDRAVVQTPPPVPEEVENIIENLEEPAPPPND